MMAHILFISPYYPPENGAASACVGETAVRLVKQGHEVTVLTTLPNYPTGIVPPEYRGRPPTWSLCSRRRSLMPLPRASWHGGKTAPSFLWCPTCGLKPPFN